jgi:hypothetical protein
MHLELLDVEEHGEDHLLATVDVTDEVGKTVRTAYVFPKDTMEWRVAEYGIDPKDTETLLDILLFEPHLQIPPEKHLYAVQDVQEAREHLLGMVAERKALSERQGPPQGLRRAVSAKDVRGKLVGMCDMDPEVISVKSEMVQKHRSRILKGQEAQARKATPDRKAKFEKLLEEMNRATDPDLAPPARKAGSEPDNGRLR